MKTVKQLINEGRSTTVKGWVHPKSKKAFSTKQMTPYHVQFIVKKPTAFGVTKKQIMDVLYKWNDGMDSPTPEEDAKGDHDELVSGKKDKNKLVEYLAMKKGWYRVVGGQFGEITGVKIDDKIISACLNLMEENGIIKHDAVGVNSIVCAEYAFSSGPVYPEITEKTKKVVDGDAIVRALRGKKTGKRTEIGQTMAMFRDWVEVTEDNTAGVAKQVKQAVKKYTSGKLVVRSKGGKTRFIMVRADKIDNKLRKMVLDVVAPTANVRDKNDISYGNISDRIISASVDQWIKALGIKESVDELDEKTYWKRPRFSHAGGGDWFAVVVSMGKDKGKIIHANLSKQEAHKKNKAFHSVKELPGGEAKVGQYVKEMSESAELGEDKLKDLIAKYKKTGRSAFHYPRKKQISLDGGRAMSEKDAIKNMKRVVGESVDELDEAKTGDIEFTYPHKGQAKAFSNSLVVGGVKGVVVKGKTVIFNLSDLNKADKMGRKTLADLVQTARSNQAKIKSHGFTIESQTEKRCLKYSEYLNNNVNKENPMKQFSEFNETLMNKEQDEKPLIKWFNEFEKVLNKSGGDYKTIKPTDMLKLYYKGVAPKSAAKQLMAMYTWDKDKGEYVRMDGEQ
jgi:hypothetical protein